MATNSHQETEVSRCGAISTKSQATQTLPVQTQPPTQLMSHEVHQFTQLINHDAGEHVHGDTMVNDSDVEMSGDTVVLRDDDDDAHDDDALSGPPLKGEDGPPLQNQRDAHGDAPPLDVMGGFSRSWENGLQRNVNAEHHAAIDAPGLATHLHRDLPDSDATTEEGDVENMGFLDADAESEPPHFDNTVDNEGNITQDALASQKTPGIVADATFMTSSQSRPRSIASVRAASLRASGLRAAGRSASIGLAGKDDAKFDLDARSGELKNPVDAPETELHGTDDPQRNKTADFDPMQSSPKATFPVDDITAHSPRMSTSRSKSKSVSPARTSLHRVLPEQDNNDHLDFDATIELNTNTIEGLLPFGRVPEKPKTDTDKLERASESLSLVPAKNSEQQVRANDAGLDADVKVQSRQPSQKARKLFSDYMETCTDKLEDGGRNAVSKALETEHVNVLKKPISAIHALAREQQCALPSGSPAASTILSYLDTQEPGEDAQVNALNMVDKLVWLDATCMSDDIATNPVPQDGSLKGHAGSKCLQSLAQAAQMKTVHDKLDVFDWEDSQLDEGVCLDTKQGTVNARARKRQSEAYKPMIARKKQATSHQQKTEYTSCMRKKGDEPTRVEKEKSTPDVGKTQVPNVEPSSSNQQVSPHAFFTTRLRNRTKAEQSPAGKGRKSPSLKSEPRKRVGKRKQTIESGKDIETGLQKGIDNIEGKVQQAGPSMKSEPKKRVGKKKSIDDLGKDLKVEQQKGGDNKERKLQEIDNLVGKAGPSMKNEPKKRVGKKKSIDDLGNDLKAEQQKGGDKQEGKLPQADPLSAKSKREPLKTSEVGPKIQCNLGLGDRTSQDDAAADMWIEAFASTKNKTPTGRSVEVIKFRKRSASHEDTGEDSKKCRTTEPGTVYGGEEHQDKSKKEETPIQEDRVEPALEIQQDSKKSKNVDAASISRHKGRIISTRRSQGENQDTRKKDDLLMEEQLVDIPPKTKLKLKKPRVADTLILSQVKGRRVSTRNSQGEHEDALKREENLMEEDKAEKRSKTRRDSKQCRNVDAAITPLVKIRGISTCDSKVEHGDSFGQAENTMEDAKLERGPKTRSKVQDVKSRVTGSDANKANRAKNAVVKSTTQPTCNEEAAGSRGAMQAHFEAERPSSKTGRPKKKESSLTHQHSTVKLSQEAHEIEADPSMVGSSGLSSTPTPVKGNEVALAGGLKRSKRRREAAGASVPESTKARKTSVSQPKERGTDKFLSKIKELRCIEKGDVSSTTVLRRTRSSTCDGGSQKNDLIDAEKEGIQIQGVPITEEQTRQNHSDNSDAKKGMKKQVAATRATKSIPRRNKKTAALDILEKLNSSVLIDEGRRRKRESGCICVLFSHSLTEDTIKHQKKILAKLGGQLATSASNCTHFVSNGFVRTQNMLMSMAAGKVVATPLWLESCGQAHYFVDEKNYILQDEKKERELGFSMIASLAAARRTPLLKGVKVLVCPNTVPEPAVLKAVVGSAGGQVMDIKDCSSQLDAKESDTIIIANEKDFDFCLQFLDKGLKVYSEELVLHGIVTQTLDFSRNRLFEDFKQQKGPKRVANINA